MSERPGLDDALAVARELGWATADLADVEHLPLGTPAQRRVARAGLGAGVWTEYGPWDDALRAYRRTSLLRGVDEAVLAACALRLGVAADRSVELLGRAAVPDALAARLLAAHGPDHARRVLTAVGRTDWREPSDHGPTALAGVVVALVDLLDLPVPVAVSYLKDWAVYARGALTGEGAPAPDHAAWVEPTAVLRRCAEHVRAAASAGLQATGPFGDVVLAVAEHGTLPRAELIDLTVAALDAARRPSERTAWARVLVDPRVATHDDLRAHADALVPVLAQGDPAVVEALAPPLLAGDEELLADVLTVSLPVRTRKAQRLVLATAAGRPRPAAHVVEAVEPFVVPLTSSSDRSLARAAAALAAAWGMTRDVATPDEPPVRAAWRPTPPLWQVPRFDVGEVTPQALTAAAATLTGRPMEVVDVEVEHFLALANAVARADREAARTALGGVRGSWVSGLRCVPAWLGLDEDPLAPWNRPTEVTWRPTDSLEPVDAREASVVARLGEVPVLLSTPTWVDLRIDPADLVQRLREYADAGAQVAEGDLHLALARTDVALATDEVRTALESLHVPVVTTVALRRGGAGRPHVDAVPHDELPTTAGPVVARYLSDPVREPALQLDRSGSRRVPAKLSVPDSLPVRVAGRTYDAPGLETFPTWGDVAATRIAWSPSADVGLLLRQAVRRATPLPPGLAVNVIGAQRSFHHAAAADGTAAVREAWERGLLRPGAADLRLLDWCVTPANVAGLARACVDLAEDGLLSVVWPLLDEVLVASVGGSRLLAGTAEVADVMLTLLPAVRVAVARGDAQPNALDLPGARALAARGGSSRAVVAARAVVADLPAPAGPTGPDASCDVAPPFDTLWPADAGAQPAAVDAATLTVQPSDTARPSHALHVVLPGGTYRVRRSWVFDVADRGRCGAAALAPDGSTQHDVWLVWDASTSRLVATPMTPRAPTSTVLSTSLVAVLLLALCQDDPQIADVRRALDRRRVGSASVTHAVRALLPSPLVSPARIVRLIDMHPTTLPCLWPVLVESVRHAAAADGPSPRWLNRVLDVALQHAPTLREAARRGLLPPACAAWPGLRDLATGAPTATVRRKAAALADALLPGPDAPQPGP